MVPHDFASKECRRKMAEAYALNHKLNSKVSEEDLKKIKQKDPEDPKQEVKAKRMRSKLIH